jgi:hypothetical protein
MRESDMKQKGEWPSDQSPCESVCESRSDSAWEQSTAAVETLAVRRDPRTGRYVPITEASAPFQEETRRALGLETRFHTGNQGARQHGVRAFQMNGMATLPPDLRRALDAFHAGLEADQAGAEELTTIGMGYVRRLTELEGCLLLLAADLETRGLLTARGRVRNSYTLLLQTIDRWDKLAQRLGMTRRAKRLPSLQEYLAQRADRDNSNRQAAAAVETAEDDGP